MACQTPYRGDTSQMLLFKIASCLAEGGAAAGVASFNGRTGIVTLTSGDVITALGCTPACEGDVVNSFNGQTGDVTLTESDVAGVADGRYVLKSGDTMTGSLNIANSAPLVASDPALDITQTWNNAAATFTGLLSNITSTAAGANSLLFDFQLGGSPILNLQATGRLLLNGQAAFINTGSVGHILNTTDALNTAVVNVLSVGHTLSAGVGAAGMGSRIDMTADSATVTSQTVLRIDSFWIDPVQATRTSAANFILPVSGTLLNHLSLTNGQAQFRDGTAALPALTFINDPDTGIYRIGANSLGMSTGGVLRFTVDNTSTTFAGTLLIPDGTAALPGLAFSADTNTGIYRIGADILGFSTAGTGRWTINASGHLVPFADGTYTVGLSIGNRPSSYFATASFEVAAGGVYSFTARGFIAASSDGVFRLLDAATTSFGRLQFGGTTSSFPSIKRSAATLQFRLADDSAFAGIATAAIVMSTAAPLSFTSGANTRAGNAVLVAGTVTVANTSVTANTIVIVTRKTVGGTIGFAVTYTVIAATSFTLTSDSALDTSTYSYILIENP